MSEDGTHDRRAGQYLEQPDGIFWIKKTDAGEELRRLSNFTARIVFDVRCDDGLETHREFEIEAPRASAIRRLAPGRE